MNPRYYYITILSILITLTSCTKEVDFNQIDDVNVHAVYTSTLIYADFTADKFLDNNNNEITYSTDLIDAPIDKTTIKYLEKVEFTLIISNSFNRQFNFNFNFFDDAGQLIYTLQPTVVVAPNSEATTYILEIPTDDISVIENTRFFGFLVKLEPSSDGSTLDGTETANLNLKSSVKLFYNYRKI
ncbi:MAG: hypothetical protein R3342_10650 [Lutibacter sp.]|uniref:hypothetical protein n=1 Tax=Lutibacter sp. TaxID=1925666 RepID=UPI00299E7F78|nr:hypothetical protein [Lutibacter sp.]MDX1829992.1 hypothetical protein [Lutibacter sp.]